MNRENKVHEPLFHLVKRTSVPKWQAWAIRGGTVLLSFLMIGIIMILAIKNAKFGDVYKKMFTGAFGSSYNSLVTFREVALLLLFALAVTPAFKMKFWNIGAEGQVLIAGLACMIGMHYWGGKVNDTLLIFICLGMALVAGVTWSVIPAIFKAKWNTNETLFTLMMNYVAIQLILFAIKAWFPKGSGSPDPSPYANLPQIAGGNFWFTIIVAIVFTAFMFVYLRFSKHGYEISVVGESENTARYVGINVKKVIIRTLVLSGLICGIIGFLLVCGIHHVVGSSTAGGRGFTAILVSWLAHFNPIFMFFTALLVAFLSRGSSKVMDGYGVANDFLPKVVTGMVFLMIIACEFFINYKIMFRQRVKEVEPLAPLPPAEPDASDEGEAAAEEEIEVADEHPEEAEQDGLRGDEA